MPSEKHRLTVLVATLIALSLCVGSSLVLGIYTSLYVDQERTPNQRIPDNIDVSSTRDLASFATDYAQKWQDSLYLESYSIRYLIDGREEPGDWIPTGEANFRFAGKRNDWLKAVAEALDVAHLLATVRLDLGERSIAGFNHSQGSPFGYDAPLDLELWPYDDVDLIGACDSHGGQVFREQEQPLEASVGASAYKPGRTWNLVYRTLSKEFGCLVNLDSGEILIQQNGSGWENVGNLVDSD
jgi:hypothetical protein